MEISKDGELLIPSPSWRQEYDRLRADIITFCKERYHDDPELYNDFIETVDMEFWTDTAPGTDPGGEIVRWEDKKACIKMLIENADNMMVFGDKIAFPNTFSRLKEIRKMLCAINNVIPTGNG